MENNIDKDIEIVEERIKTLNSHISNYEKQECKTAVYQELVKERNATSKVLEELKIRGKMIDSMSNEIYLEIVKEDGQHFKTSEEVKEHFKKEAEKNE